MTTKAAARTRARQARLGIDLAAVSEGVVGALRAWEGLAGDPVVLVYAALPDEVDVSPLAGPGAVLPRVSADGRVTLHPFSAPRERHRLGFEQPAAGAAVVDPATVDVALVPGLAFDRTGVRLGRGGGHYDRLLATLRPDALVVGVTPAALVGERLPREAHDRVMTHLATESGVVRVPPMPTVSEWVAGDPDAATRAELLALADAGADLGDRMTPLEFGTAGIRGEVGAGPGRMNRAVVIRTTRGLADYLAGRRDAGGRVVVGYDGRTDSRRFAEDVVGVLRAAGFVVNCFEGTTPTPLIAHAVRRLGAVAGVVITASHNPPRDNGYKVYDAGGAQIVPPVDAGISAAIALVGPAAAVPRDRVFAGESAGAAEDAYVADVLGFRGPAPAPGTVPIVYTALHGVAGRCAVRLLAEAGHDDVTPVAEQFEPDGAFPTVAFPNPEEPGALDRAEALAASRGAALVLANDPDGDRLGVSIPDGSGWRRLTGNEIGVLLGDFVLERTGGADRFVVTTVVSTPMLAAVAAHHGVGHELTLTGFKWICNAALDLEAAGGRFVFGFEEALGYAVGPTVRDKDGMSAALWFADLAAVCAAAGETVADRLARLCVRDGLWVSHPLNLRRAGPDGLSEIAAAVTRLAAAPPAALDGTAVAEVRDYSTGAAARPRWLPATPLVELGLADGSRVMVRPSGTEPKLKIYTDVRAAAPAPDRVAAVRAEALQRAAELAAATARVLGMA